jgi:hypothetical protein
MFGPGYIIMGPFNIRLAALSPLTDESGRTVIFGSYAEALAELSVSLDQKKTRGCQPARIWRSLYAFHRIRGRK